MYGCVPNNKENEKVNLWSNKESAKEWVSRDFGKLGEVPNSVIPVSSGSLVVVSISLRFIPHIICNKYLLIWSCRNLVETNFMKFVRD